MSGNSDGKIDWNAGTNAIPDPPQSMTTAGKPANGFNPTASDPNWPVLDTAAYHGLAGKVVENVLPHTESDPIALLVQYLVSFGNVVGRRPYYEIENTQHYPVLFALLAGSTAKARKGTSAQRVRQIFQGAAPDWVANNIASGISSGEGILHAVRDPIWGEDKKTKELKLVDPGIEDKRLLLDEREFSSALASAERAGNIVERVVRDAWDCPETLRTLTKHSPTKATQPHISIIAHITIDELRRRLTESSMANGFANRFLYACIRRSKLLPHGSAASQIIADQLGAATRDAITNAARCQQMTMTTEATQRWDTIYVRLTEDVPGLLGALTARSDAQTIRLAMIYALLDQSTQIDVIHLEAASALWTYCEASTRYIFGDLTGDRVADTILRALRHAGTDGMSRSDIHNHFGRNITADKISAAFGMLLAAGKVRSDKQKSNNGGPGRVREMWFIV